MLLVVRWAAGPGPQAFGLASARRYRADRGEGGLLLAPVAARPAQLGELEQASLYRHWQGARPGPGFLDGTAPISYFAVDVDEAAVDAWDAYYREEHFPAVLSLPGYGAGGRFRLNRRLSAGLGRDPEWLTLYQLVDEDALRRLSTPGEQPAGAAETYADWLARGAPATRNLIQGRYRPDGPPAR